MGDLFYVGDNDRPPRLDHGSGDPLPRLQANVLHRLGRHPHHHRKIEFLGLGIDEQQRPVFGGNDRIDALQHLLEEGFHVIDACQHFGEGYAVHQTFHLPGIRMGIDDTLSLVHMPCSPL